MKLTKQDLHTPFSGRSEGIPLIDKLRAIISRLRDRQATAATATTLMGTAISSGTLRDLYLFVETAAAAGESMTFDIKKNGVSILSGVYTYDSTVTTQKAKISLMSLVTDKVVAEGDAFTCVRTYVAGGGPTPVRNTEAILEAA